jgi:hypothetical protein|uniref:Uncharacterized protein n=1 Tax=viral metagenome TaxID=1070528 RepID=A0A6C0KPL8_9ZZZZ
MARSKHQRRHRKSKTYKKHSSKKRNFIGKTFSKSVGLVKNTSKKYIPKVESGLENVGSKVVKTGSNTIPYLQRMTRNLFGMFSTKKNRKNRK